MTRNVLVAKAAAGSKPRAHEIAKHKSKVGELLQKQKAAAKADPKHRGKRCRVQKAEEWHHRWRIYYPEGPQQVYSEPWTETISPLEALKTLLKEIWELHEQSMAAAGELGHGCPFDIDALPMVVATHPTD